MFGIYMCRITNEANVFKSSTRFCCCRGVATSLGAGPFLPSNRGQSTWRTLAERYLSIP